MLATLSGVVRQQRNRFFSHCMTSASTSATVDLDYVHPEIRVPVVPRIKLFNLPKHVSRDWLRKALAKVSHDTQNMALSSDIHLFFFFFFFRKM
jgi:hypothetical protein